MDSHHTSREHWSGAWGLILAAADQALFPQDYAAIGYGPLWRDPRGWALFRRVYEGYLRHPGDIPFERPVLARTYLDYAHQFDQPREFLRIVEEYRDSGLLDPEAFARAHGYPLPLGATKARLQLDQPRLCAEFSSALSARRFPQAESLLHELDAAAPDARTYLDLPRRTLHVRSQLEPENDWRDFVATPAIRPWIQRKGRWHAALDGAFFGRCNCNRNMILVHKSIPRGCEIAADVEILHAPPGESPNVALVIERNKSTFVALSLYPAANEIRLSRGKDKFLRTAFLPPARDASPRRLRLRFEDGTFSAWVDGIPCFAQQRFPKMNAGISVRPGLGAFYRSEKAACLFRNVRIRPLSPDDSP